MNIGIFFNLIERVYTDYPIAIILAIIVFIIIRKFLIKNILINFSASFFVFIFALIFVYPLLLYMPLYMHGISVMNSEITHSIDNIISLLLLHKS